MASDEERKGLIFWSRPGVRAYLGHEFERNLTILVSFRCQELYDAGTLKDFYVLENVDGVGAFDDVVVYIEYELNGVSTKKILFIQAKRKENLAKHVVKGNFLFFRAEGSPEIIEFYKSSCLVYELLNSECTQNESNTKVGGAVSKKEKKDALQKLFKCKSDDCLFIYYTNMPVSRDIEKEFIQSNKYKIDNSSLAEITIVNKILNTSKQNFNTVLKLDRIKCEDNEICGEHNTSDFVPKFISNFRIYAQQQSDLKQAVLHEIDISTSYKFESSILYSKICSEFEYIYSKNPCVPVNTAINTFRNVLAVVNLEKDISNIRRQYSYFNNLFKHEVHQELYDVVRVHQFCKVVSNKGMEELELIKFIELTRTCRTLEHFDQSSLFLILISSDDFTRWKCARNTEVYKNYTNVILLTKRQIFAAFENMKYRQNEHFLILCQNPDLNTGVTSYKSVPCSDISEEITDHGMKQILEYEVSFQGHQIYTRDLGSNFILESNSNLIIKMARSEELKIGDLLPIIDPYYIERAYKNKDVVQRDSDFAINCLSEKVTIISDVAGMGKTTALKSLCNLIKIFAKNYWVQYIELKLHIQTLSAIEENISPDTAVAVVSNLLELKYTEEMIFRYLCLTTGNAVLLFDGYDEISPQAENQFKYLVAALSKTKVQSIIISTRPNVATALEKVTNQLSSTIMGFTTEDQEQFLTKYWADKLRDIIIDPKIFSNLVQNVVKEIERNREVLNEVAGIPLQTRMIAEIYQDVIQQCLHVGSSDKIDIKIDLYELYDRFIALHIDRCMTEKYNLENLESSIYDDIKTARFKAESGIWEAVACKEILPKLNAGVQYTKKDINAICNVGIISKLNPHTFMHRTFAEFLSAKFIANIMYEGCDKKTLKFIVDEILLYDEYVVFRKFLNAIWMNMQTWKECNNNYNSDSKHYDSAIRKFLNSIFLNKMLLKQCHTDVRKAIKVWQSKIKDTEYSPIHVAARDGNAEILQFLWRHGADINCRNEYGATPLHWAARWGHTDAVKCLAQHGADIKCRNEYGATPIHWAAEGGRTDTVKWLAQHGADINCMDTDGYMPIYQAAMKGHTDTVEWLAQQGADINCRNEWGDTPIHWAAQGGHTDTVKWLAQHGADINATNNKGETPAARARRRYDVWDDSNRLETATYLEGLMSEQSKQ